MKKILVLFAGLFLFAVTGCETVINGSDPNYKEKSYIQSFSELNNISVGFIKGFEVDKTQKTVCFLGAGFDHPMPYEITDGIGIVIDISDNPEIWIGSITKWGDRASYYNELVEKIGDTHFDTVAYIFQSVALADTLKTINITCNKDIDSNHPAGSSLNDIFSIYFDDICAVIKNGYKTLTGQSYYSILVVVDGEICVLEDIRAFYGTKLSSVNLPDKPHSSPRLYLILDTAPENTDEYLFTVSITNTKGKTIEGVSEPIKIKGLNSN